MHALDQFFERFLLRGACDVYAAAQQLAEHLFVVGDGQGQLESVTAVYLDGENPVGGVCGERW